MLFCSAAVFCRDGAFSQFSFQTAHWLNSHDSHQRQRLGGKFRFNGLGVPSSLRITSSILSLSSICLNYPFTLHDKAVRFLRGRRAGMSEAGEIIKSGAADKLADIIHKLAGPMAEEIGLLMADTIKVYRVKNWLKVAEKTQALLGKAKLPPTAVPPRLFLP